MKEPSNSKDTTKRVGALKLIRKEFEISQVNMAKILGVSQGLVSKVENVQMELHFKQIIKLIYALDLDPNYVIGLFLEHDYKEDESMHLLAKVYELSSKRKQKRKSAKITKTRKRAA